MANTWTSYLWKNRQDLTGSELVCALALARRADRAGKCPVVFKILARDVRVSVRHVSTLISRLEKKGVIRVSRGCCRGYGSVFQLIKRENKARVESGKKGDLPIGLTEVTKKPSKSIACTENLSPEPAISQTEEKEWSTGPGEKADEWWT